MGQSYVPAIASSLLLGILSSASHATTLTPVEFINEFLMETQVENVDAVVVQYGPDASSPLQFTSNINPSAYSFTFQTVAGSMYLGQPITLTGSGVFNSSSNTWTLSGTGMVGTNSWTTAGIDTITSSDVAYTSETNFYKKGKRFGDLTDSCEVDEEKDTSDCKYTPTGPDGNPVGPPFPGRDPFTEKPDPKGGKDIIWGENIDGGLYGFTITSIGDTPLDGGDGTFTTDIAATPEPGTILLFGAGLVAILGIRLKLRQI